MLSGAALFANAISTSRAIMYSLSGGYLGLCARSAPAFKVASRKTRLIVSFFISDNLLIEIALAQRHASRRRRTYAIKIVTKGDSTRAKDELTPWPKLVSGPGLAEF